MGRLLFYRCCTCFHPFCFSPEPSLWHYFMGEGIKFKRDGGFRVLCLLLPAIVMLSTCFSPPGCICSTSNIFCTPHFRILHCMSIGLLRALFQRQYWIWKFFWIFAFSEWNILYILCWGSFIFHSQAFERTQCFDFEPECCLGSTAVFI